MIATSTKKYIFSILGVLSVFAMVVLGMYVARVLTVPVAEVGEIGEDVITTPPPATGKVNILIVGTDMDGVNTDVIMIMSLDPLSNRINIMSVPRDTRTMLGSSYAKINSAYIYAKINTKNEKVRALGQEGFLINTISQISGLPIHYYAIFSFSGFRQIIDSLGGVDFDVPVNMDYNDPVQNLSIHVRKGFQHLNGRDAEGVVRYRHTYAMGDYDRINVQQDFVKALLAQKLKLEYVQSAPAILDALSKNLITNVSVADTVRYGNLALKVPKENFRAFTLPGQPQTINDLSYYIADEHATVELVETEFGYGSAK